MWMLATNGGRGCSVNRKTSAFQSTCISLALGQTLNKKARARACGTEGSTDDK